jgi:hypothetical protein
MGGPMPGRADRGAACVSVLHGAKVEAGPQPVERLQA